MTRVWLVLICLALVVLALVGMWLGWRNRERRQADLPELPALPADLGAQLLDTLDGEYVGTAYATSWQDRVVHGGLGIRSGARLRQWHLDLIMLGGLTAAAPSFVPDPPARSPSRWRSAPGSTPTRSGCWPSARAQRPPCL